MIQLQALLFDGQNSRSREVTLRFNEGVLYIEDLNGAFTQQLPWSQVTPSPRLGNTPRRLQLSEGAVLETRENNQVDHILREGQEALSSGLWIHTLESGWSWALASTDSVSNPSTLAGISGSLMPCSVASLR